MTDAQPVSWRGIVYGTPVLSSENTPMGMVHEVLGSDAEDIFHGLRVGLSGTRREVMIEADDISDLSAEQIHTSLAAADFPALPDYREEATYHLASVGWLRKHLGWAKDSTRDEEPG